MKKFNFRNFMEAVAFHGSIFVRGIGRTLYGAVIAGLFGISIYGFISIQSEAGYTAVFDFITAIATLTVAMCSVYLLGVNKKRGGKK
jgi:hypothetical protein